jgi:hypothetical protein
VTKQIRDLSDRELLVAIYERVAVVERSYVRRDEFTPVQRVVYGMVALIGATVLGALFSLVIK